MAMASVTLLRVPQVNASVNLSFSKSETLSATCVSLSRRTSSPSPCLAISSPLIKCGRGDKKTARGKRFRHSYGNARPRNKNKGRGPQRVPAPPAPPRKDKFDYDDDDDDTPIEIDESPFTNDEF